MLQNVRISSKRQITIPSKIFQNLGLQEGDSLVLEVKNNQIIMQKEQALLDELAGSVELPQEYKGKTLDFIIQDSKGKYFASKK